MHQASCRRSTLVWFILGLCAVIALLVSALGQTQLRMVWPPQRFLPILGASFVDSSSASSGASAASSCRGYRELAGLKFLEDDELRRSLCQPADEADAGSSQAFSLQGGRFPLCRLAANLSKAVMQEVSAAALPLQLHNEATRRQVSIFGYPGDSISSELAHSHSWESELVTKLVKVALGLSAGQQPVTFLDVGSNIGVYSLSARDAGLTTVAVDANLRNLARLRLASQAMRWPTSDPRLTLVWAYFADRVSLRYLSFPEAVCNVGGAGGETLDGKDGGVWATDTVPVMTAEGDDLLPLLRNNLVVAKIDIETSEIVFLNTGKRLFDQRRLAVVQMEWWRSHAALPASRTPHYRQLVQFFLGRNYTLLSARSLQRLDPWNFYDWDTLWVRVEYVNTVLNLLNSSS